VRVLTRAGAPTGTAAAPNEQKSNRDAVQGSTRYRCSAPSLCHTAAQ